MNENINLCELLKGHEGETFYCSLLGNVVLIDTKRQGNPIIIDGGYTFSSDGKININGECLLFPSKNQRDWNKWAEEQKPKLPKTFTEIPLVKRDYLVRNLPDFELNKIQKSALALIKIHQLIEIGYGGNITNEEWEDDSLIKYVILNNNSKITSGAVYKSYRHIAFHTSRQREEFLLYPENVQLVKDFYMI